MNESKSPSVMFTMSLVFGGILLLLIVGISMWYAKAFDTQYAPGYSARKFDSIKLGDSETAVRASLGQPFSTDDTTPYEEWIYAAGDQRRFARRGEGSGTYTTIRFDADHRVVSVHGMQQTSASTFSFGDGLNYLKLTESQIEKLKGQSQGDIKNQFGPPVATYQDKTSKLLRYSRSPSSANYHFRAIGLDEEGKVVRIWREIYWD